MIATVHDGQDHHEDCVYAQSITEPCRCEGVLLSEWEEEIA
ncbi:MULTISPECIES: hypothetical protein [unclassified Streptomyces]